MSINVVVLSGRLGKDPEIKSTTSGKSVGNFTIAVDDGFGENKKTDWFLIEVWDKVAEAVGRLVTKGSRVSVTGRLRTESWTDKDSGQNRSRTKIVATSVDIIDFAEKQPDEDVPF